MIILLVLALVSPYSPWKRREEAEGANEEAEGEKGENRGNREGNFGGGMFGANGMQAGGGSGAQMPMGGGARYPQMMGAQQAYMQPGYDAPEAKRSRGNTAPYVPVSTGLFIPKKWRLMICIDLCRSSSSAWRILTLIPRIIIELYWVISRH